MLLRSISIENFKAIRGKIELEFDPEVNIYVLVGKNSSGKSTILEAIRRACWENPVPSNIKAEFNSKLITKPRAYYIRSTKGIHDYFGSSRFKNPEKSDFEKLMERYKEDELEELSKVVSASVSKDIRFTKAGQELRVFIEGQEIKTEDLSSGIQAVLTIEAVLHYPPVFRFQEENYVIFLMEEPEAFLHPNLLRTYAEKLVRFAKERKNVQLFISTHSPILLSFVEPYQVIRLEEGKAYYTKEKDFGGWHMMTDPAKSEIFFADRVIMFEGYTDKVVFSALLKKFKVNPELKNVSLIHVDGAYNREAITKICEAFEIKNLFIGDKDQEKHKKRGGNRKDLSFEFLLPYGEMEDCIPLLDWAVVLKEEFISFLHTLLSNDSDKTTEILKKVFRNRKSNYTLKLREYYLNHSIHEDHPLYPLVRIIRLFVETGDFREERFPEKDDIRSEVEKFIFLFIQEDIKGDLQVWDVCKRDDMVAGVFFKKEHTKKLSELLLTMIEKEIVFYAVFDESYDLKVFKNSLSQEHRDYILEDSYNCLSLRVGKSRSVLFKAHRPLSKVRDMKAILELQPLSEQ